MTIVFQSSPTQKRIFDPLRLQGWNPQLTLSSLFYLLSRLRRRYLLIQLRLTSRLPYFCSKLVSPRLYTQTLPLLHQLVHNLPFFHLKLVNPNLLKNFLHLVPSYPTSDPFYQDLINLKFNLLNLL